VREPEPRIRVEQRVEIRRRSGVGHAPPGAITLPDDAGREVAQARAAPAAGKRLPAAADTEPLRE
jgi:hypothetical protein